MKKYLFLIAIMFCLIIPNVNATTIDIALECNPSVKKENNIKCEVYAKIIIGAKLLEIDADINAESSYFTPSTSEFRVNTGWDEGEYIKLGEFHLSSLSKEGTGDVTLENIKATFDNETKDVDKVTTSIKVLSDEKKLDNILINEKTIEGFKSNDYSYDLTIDKKEINIEAEKSTNTKSVSGIGTKSLTCGNNKIIIKATAEDNSTKDYTLNIKRNCKSDANLKMIKLSSGALSPTFSSTTKSYKVEVSKDIEKITISATKNDETQNIKGEVKNAKLEYGDNKFEIKVEAEDGSKNTYTVVVNREDARSENNDLESLTLSDGRLEFDKDTLSYTTKVLYEVESITVKATPKDKTSKVEITGGKKLKLGENKIIIKVTSEKGETKEYQIIVNRLEEGETLGDNPDIKEIIIEGYEIEFDKTKEEYNLKINDEKSLNIKVVMDDETSTYLIEGNEKLKDGSIIKINTKSLDGSEKTYSINIEKESVSIILIIVILIIGITAGLIIFLIINNKKNPNKVKTKVIKDKELMKKVDKQLEQTKEIVNEPIKEAIIIDDPDNEIEEYNNIISNKKVFDEKRVEEETKECTICGNHVLKSAKVCPYCKRTWS